MAEKLAAELAALLGIATPPVELATRRNERGVICRRMNDPELTQLVHGNELLARIDPAYADSPLRNNPHYSIGAVRAERMPEPTRTFVTAMLSVNRRRVLDVRR